MKRLFFLLLILSSCGDDKNDPKPVQWSVHADFDHMVDEFIDDASTYGDVDIEKENLIVRYVSESDDLTNNSRSFKEGQQRIIEIDQEFYVRTRNDINQAIWAIVYQQLAITLMGRGYDDCGIMKPITVWNDVYSPRVDGLSTTDYWGNFESMLDKLFNPNHDCYFEEN